MIRLSKHFAVLIAFFGAATSALGQEIVSLSVTPQSPGVGEPVRIKISLKAMNGVYACGLQVNLGDGQTKEFRVYDERAAQIELEHIYSRPGAYPIVADGKGFLRGLKSVGPCDGNRSLALTVGQQAPACVPPSDEYRSVNCPPGTVGKILQKRSYVCPGPTPSGWKTESTDCKANAAAREPSPPAIAPRTPTQPATPQPSPPPPTSPTPRPAPKPQVGE